jgi:hydroxymethylbilane synthase
VALERLDRADAIADILPIDVVLPQVGQGALAVECRANDDENRAVLAGVQHEPSRRAFDAERAFLSRLGGDCDLPAGAYARVLDDTTIQVEGLIASLDGRIVLRHRAVGTEPVEIGHEVADHLLDRAGGREVLSS